MGILRKFGRFVYWVSLSLIAATVLVVVAAVVLFPQGDAPGDASGGAAQTDPARAEEDASAAFRYACREFTKAQLLDPASAEFTPSLYWKRTQVGEDRWRVVSEVTAANAFGGRVASRFLCDLQAVGDEIRLISISEVGR